MSLVVNHNMMAANSSRYLNTHYKALSDSTRKLSSGLRVETAADDAAGSRHSRTYACGYFFSEPGRA